jgi:4-hydroxy-4-methyl-2-oxoglutarate aldolase
VTATVKILDFPRPDRELLARLEPARTPDVANVLGPSCVADPALRPVWRGARVLGAALTVRLTPGDNLGAIVASINCEAGDVLVADCGDGPPAAIVGSLGVRTAHAHGMVGMIIDGAVRDTAALEAMRFPVWTRYVSPRQASKDKPCELGVPVTCGGVRVNPGDIVLADDDGIVFVSPAALAEALAAIEKGVANEKRWEDPAALLEAIRTIVGRATIERK